MKPCSKTPCKECPFMRTSLRGWLGPWTPENLHRHVVGEEPFACHLTMGKDDEHVPEHRQTVCAGSILYANNIGKRFLDPAMVKMQENMRGIRSEVMGLAEFIAHHTRKPK